MRVVHVVLTHSYGGTEAVVATVARRQRELGLDVEIYSFANSDSDGHFNGMSGVTFRDQRTFAEFLLNKEYDVIHVTSPASKWAGEGIRKSFYKGGVLVTSHCPRDHSQELRYDIPTGVSNYVAQTIQQFYSAPVRVVYNCVDTDVFRPDSNTTAPDGEPLIGWAGRSQDPVKDIGILMALANSPQSEGFKIFVADASPVDTDLSAWLPDSARFVRRLAYGEMPGYYYEIAASGGFFLSTSRDEAFGLNLLEALACGCPVIAPALGGIGEVVKDRVTGCLYDRSEGLAGIRRAIDWLYSGDNYARSAKAAVEHAAEMFSADRIARQYVSLYEEAARIRRVSIFMPLIRGGAKTAAAARRVWRARKEKREGHV
ncbi:MAG: glycosyltransferase family 4 protein [Armatimonadetes bacterium]|nr:glycosyltransferase family 4 protein [Armatimonadota bacterium]